MLEHRFRELVRSSSFQMAATAPMMECAFVPCPMFQAYGMADQARLQEIYRIAAERTRDQLQQWQPRHSRMAEFSVN